MQSFINELAGGDWHFFKDLVQAFVQDSDRYIETLKQYCQEPDQQDQTHIRRIIHTLKSSSGSMFAGKLSEQCRLLESMWNKYEHTQKVAAIETLSQEYQRAKFELTHLADR